MGLTRGDKCCPGIPVVPLFSFFIHRRPSVFFAGQPIRGYRRVHVDPRRYPAWVIWAFVRVRTNAPGDVSVPVSNPQFLWAGAFQIALPVQFGFFEKFVFCHDFLLSWQTLRSGRSGRWVFEGLWTVCSSPSRGLKTRDKIRKIILVLSCVLNLLKTFRLNGFIFLILFLHAGVQLSFRKDFCKRALTLSI